VLCWCFQCFRFVWASLRREGYWITSGTKACNSGRLHDHYCLVQAEPKQWKCGLSRLNPNVENPENRDFGTILARVRKSGWAGSPRILGKKRVKPAQLKFRKKYVELSRLNSIFLVEICVWTCQARHWKNKQWKFTDGATRVTVRLGTSWKKRKLWFLTRRTNFGRPIRDKQDRFLRRIFDKPEEDRFLRPIFWRDTDFWIRKTPKPSFYKSSRSCPNRWQRGFKAQCKKPAKFQAAVSICQFLWAGSLLYIGNVSSIHVKKLQSPPGTSCYIWSVISPIFKLNRLSSSLRLFGHFPLKRVQLDWDWRMRLNDTPNAIGCTISKCDACASHLNENSGRAH